MGWVGLGHTKWTRGQLCRPDATEQFCRVGSGRVGRCEVCPEIIGRHKRQLRGGDERVILLCVGGNSTGCVTSVYICVCGGGVYRQDCETVRHIARAAGVLLRYTFWCFTRFIIHNVYITR